MKPKDIMNKTLLTLNFLNIWSKENLSAAELHFQGKEEDVNESGTTSESYQSFACHDGGADMSGNQHIGK